MARIEHSIVINQPIDRVFAFISNAQNDPYWQLDILESRQTSPGPVGVGTQIAAVRQVMGRKVDETRQVTDYQPYQRFCIRTTSKPEAEVINMLEQVPGGTKLSLVLDVNPPGFAKLAGPLFTNQLRKQTETNFNKLKEMLEAQR